MLSIDRTAEEVECEDLVKVTIGDDPEKFFQIGSQLPQKEREELMEFLKQNMDVFAWNAELMEFLKQNMDVFAWNAYKAPGVDP